MPNKGHHLSNCLYWPELKSISNLLTVRFSFLTYLLTFDQKNQRTRCTACLYGLLSRIILLS